MIARYRTLAARIRDELADLERTQAAVQRHWSWAQTASDHQDAYLNSVALNLHAFYSGIERIFELVAAYASRRHSWTQRLTRRPSLMCRAQICRPDLDCGGHRRFCGRFAALADHHAVHEDTLITLRGVALHDEGNPHLRAPAGAALPRCEGGSALSCAPAETRVSVEIAISRAKTAGTTHLTAGPGC